MDEVPAVCIWTHRWSPLIERCAAGVARHTRGDYDLIVVCREGTCHQNMNRALARSRSRYTVFLDDDVEILTDGWLEHLLADLAAEETLGVVGCLEVKDPFAKALYREQPERFTRDCVERVTWIPAYVMCFDRGRFPCLRFDERIPGAKGMTDVDACLQLRRHGLGVALDRRVVVYHPHKTREMRHSDGVPTEEEERAWFEKQREYMAAKWGELYASDPTLCPSSQRQRPATPDRE